MGKAMRRLGWGIVVVSASLLCVGTARADEPEKKESSWYGHQTLIADVAAVGLIGGAFVVNDKAVSHSLGVASLGVYTLGAPTVHTAHGHLWAGAVDLGIRIASPLAMGVAGLGVGLGVASETNASDPSYYALTGGAIGIGTGIVTAIALDAVHFAREPAPNTDSQPKTATTIRPALAPQRDGFSAGLTGTF